MATTTATTQYVQDALKVSNLRNDMRDINALASHGINNEQDARAALRRILRISREAIYK